MRHFEVLLTLHLLLSPLIELSLVTSLSAKKKQTSTRQHTRRRHDISRDQMLKKKSTTSTTSTKKVRFFLSCFKDGDGEAIKCSPVSHDIISDSEDKTKHGKKVARRKTTSKIVATNRNSSYSSEEHSKTTSKITSTNKTSSYSNDEQSNVREKTAHYQRIGHGSNQTDHTTEAIVQVNNNNITGYKGHGNKDDNSTKNGGRRGTGENKLPDEKSGLLSNNQIANRIHKGWSELNRTDYDTVGALIKFFNNQDNDVFKTLRNDTSGAQTISPTPSTKRNTNNSNSRNMGGHRQNVTASASSPGQRHDVALDLNFIMQSVMSRRQSYLQKQVEAGILDMTYGRKNNVTSHNLNGNHILPEIMLGNAPGKVSKLHKFHNKSDDEDIMAMAGVQGDVGDDFHNASVNTKNVGDKKEMPSENPRLLMEEFMTSYMNRSTPLLQTAPQHVLSNYKGNKTQGGSSGNRQKDKVRGKVLNDAAEQVPFNDSVLEQHLKQHFIPESKDEQTSKYQKDEHNNNNSNDNNNDENNNSNYHNGKIYNFRIGLEQVASNKSSKQLTKPQSTSYPTLRNTYGHQPYTSMTVKMSNPANQYDLRHNKYATMRHIYEDPRPYKPRLVDSIHRSINFAPKFAPAPAPTPTPTPTPNIAIASRFSTSAVFPLTATPELTQQPSIGGLRTLSLERLPSSSTQQPLIGGLRTLSLERLPSSSTQQPSIGGLRTLSLERLSSSPSLAGFLHSRSSLHPSLSSFKTDIDTGATSSTVKFNSRLPFEMYLSEMQKRFSELTPVQEETPTLSPTLSPTPSFEPNTPTTLRYHTPTPGLQRLSQYIDEMQQRFDEISVNKTIENQIENTSIAVYISSNAPQDQVLEEMQDGAQIWVHSAVHHSLESLLDVTKSLLHQIHHTPTPAQKYDASMEEEINNQFEANLEYFPMEKIEDIFSDIEEARSMIKNTKTTHSKQAVMPQKTLFVRSSSTVMSLSSIKRAESTSSTAYHHITNITISPASPASINAEASRSSFAASIRASPSSHHEPFQTINASSVMSSPSTKQAEVYKEFVSVYQELYGGVKDDFTQPDADIMTMEENSNQTVGEEVGDSIKMIPKNLTEAVIPKNLTEAVIPKNLTEADCDEVRSFFPAKDRGGKPVSGDEAFLLMKRNVDWDSGKYRDLEERSELMKRCHVKKLEKEQMRESVLKLHSSYEVSALTPISSSSKHINRPQTAATTSLAMSSSSSKPWWMLDRIAMMKELNQLAIYSVYSPPPPSGLRSHFKSSSTHTQIPKHSPPQSSMKKFVTITSPISSMRIRASPAEVNVKTPAIAVKYKAPFTPAKALLIPSKAVPVKVTHFMVQSVKAKSFSNTTSDNAEITPNNRQAPSSSNNGKPVSIIDAALSNVNNYYNRLLGINPKDDKALETNTNNEPSETSWNPLQDIESMDGKTGGFSTNNEPSKTTLDFVVLNNNNKPSKATPNPSVGISPKAGKIVVPNTPKEHSKTIWSPIAALNVKVMSLNVSNPHPQSLTVPITEDSSDVLSLSKLMSGDSGKSGALSNMLSDAVANSGRRNANDTQSKVCGKNFLAQLKFPPNLHEFSKADIKKNLENEISTLYSNLPTYLSSNVVWVDDLKNAVGPEVGVDVELYFSERGCDHLQPLQQRVKLGHIRDFFVNDGTYSLLDDRIGAFNYWCQQPCADPYHCFPLCDNTCCGTQRMTSSTTNHQQPTGLDILPLSGFPQHLRPVQLSQLLPPQQQLHQAQPQPQQLPPQQMQPKQPQPQQLPPQQRQPQQPQPQQLPSQQRQPQQPQPQQLPPQQRQPQQPQPQQLPSQQRQSQQPQPQQLPPQQRLPQQPRPELPQQQLQHQRQPQPPQQLAPSQPPFMGKHPFRGEDIPLMSLLGSNSLIQPTVVYCNKLCRLFCDNSCNPVCCPDKEADLRQQYGAKYTGLGRR